MRGSTEIALAALAASTVAACDGPQIRPVAPDAPPPGERETVDIPIAGPAPLDVLLVIDDSGSMNPYQAQLGTAFHRLTEALAAGGALPDLHLGVVSSDLGTLGVGTADASCARSDQGQLQTSGCAGLVASFLTDRLDPSTGGRLVNYTGTFDDAVSCMVGLGHNGCGFEQHLEAMKLALATPDFIRPEADLAILILGDEDDCSAFSPQFFAPESDLLGPLDSFRCFEFGAVCDPDDPRTDGAKSGCIPREDSPYLYPTTRYLDFVRELKSDPSRVSVGLIAGPTTPVEVHHRTPEGSNFPRPDLLPSCDLGPTTGLWADPAIRLSTFATGFEHSVVGTICAEDYPALSELGAMAHRNTVGDPCFDRTVIDTDGDPTNGIQADCYVTWLEPDQPARPLAACNADATNQPCWRIGETTNCTAGAHHALVIVAPSDLAPATRAHASCAVE